MYDKVFNVELADISEFYNSMGSLQKLFFYSSYTFKRDMSAS